jgi:D-erythrulose 4-kinase
VVEDNEEHLGRLDSVAGDGDHGLAMVRGLRAAVAIANETAGGLGPVLRAAGEAFADHAGGSSGALWGLALQVAGDDLGDATLPDAVAVAAAIKRATEALSRAGGATVGDRSMLDALAPFADQLAGDVTSMPLAEAWPRAAAVATAAANSTAGLWPRVGRARPLGARSLGVPDPGAVSMALCLEAAGSVLAGAARGDRQNNR